VRPSADDSHDAIRSYEDYREFLAADLAAHGLAGWNVDAWLRNPQLRYQRVLRLAEYLRTRRNPAAKVLYAFVRLRLARLSLVSGISIPPGVFGRGLSIAHYGSIVVNDQVRVGSYCRIHSATNIGVHGGSAPTLGDFVYVGPGAVVYGAA
jgi:serine O-acetyltransferase